MNYKTLKQTIADLLDEHHSLIYENFNEKSDQILLDAKLIAEIEKTIQSQTSNPYLQKDTLKKILREILQLEPQDLLIVKNGHVFIKLVSELEQKVPQGRRNTNEVRYNGYDESELISFYNEFFSDEDVSKLIDDIVKRFVNKYIIQKGISNDEYERRAFAYIKELFFEFLQKRFENKDEFLLGFSGYLFRINFEKVFIKLAENILHKVAKGNQKIVTFLEYYSNDVIIQHGEKYRVPTILSKNGHKWKVVSITPVVRVYFTTRENISQL